MRLKPFYQQQGHRFYFASPEACLHYLQRGTLGEHDHVFVFNDWYIPDHPPGLQAYHRLVELDQGNLRIMCNSKRERSFLVDRIGFSEASTLPCSLHFMHGTTAATRVFMLRNGATPQHRAVLNARSKDYKNRWAARGVSKLACIDLLGKSPEFDCQYYNAAPLTLDEVVTILHRACVGLILSFAEGASLASLEYLLCGLPVVSTHSYGGRDAWYDENNCILVGPDVEAGLAGDFDKQALCQEVSDAVDMWIARIERGNVDAKSIRDSALAVNEKFYANFIAAIRKILATESDQECDTMMLDKMLDELRPYYTYGAYRDC